MSYYSQVVLEVKKDVFDRLMRYWKDPNNRECPEIRRPDVFLGGSESIIMTYEGGWNHAPHASDIADTLEVGLGLDYADYYVVVRGEGYDGEHPVGTEGGLTPSFELLNPPEEGWFTHIVYEDSVFPKFQPSFRREQAEMTDAEALHEISEAIRELADVFRDINYTLGRLWQEKR